MFRISGHKLVVFGKYDSFLRIWFLQTVPHKWFSYSHVFQFSLIETNISYTVTLQYFTYTLNKLIKYETLLKDLDLHLN